MCHTAETTLVVLRPIFKDGIISRRADIVWPPRICDLTPLDYCLWGAVKDKCYADKPETIDDLKDNVGNDNSIMCLKIGSIVLATAWQAEAAI